MAMVNITDFGIQSGTDRSVFVTWTWSKDKTQHYKVEWDFATGDGHWWTGSHTTTEDKQSIWSAPENAKKVRVRVKAVPKTKTEKGKKTTPWSCSWTGYREKRFADAPEPPSTPPVPSVSIEGFTLSMQVDNVDTSATAIIFDIVKDDSIHVFNEPSVPISTSHASHVVPVDVGHNYKVRCRAYRYGDMEYSEWSDYSDNVATMPATPTGITVSRATSSTSVYLEWTASNMAETYDVEYATTPEHFQGSNATQSVTGVETNHYEITGLETGKTYFFRVRAINPNGTTGWCPISNPVYVGTKPSAPTTWSSTTTAKVGEEIILYWVHNSQDGSSQIWAQVELSVDGVVETRTIDDTGINEVENKTRYLSIDTSQYVEGTNIRWRVRTAGVTREYGDWSVERSIDVYAPPTLTVNVTNSSGDTYQEIDSFPFFISAETGPVTQKPIGFHVSIVSNQTYETVDDVGNIKMVKTGEEVFANYYARSWISVRISADNINLENGMSYTVKVTASMDSGLVAESSTQIKISWMDLAVEPDAEISYDEETITTRIKPYCRDDSGSVVGGITLSVYRREYDGSFTELITGVENTPNGTWVTDPHPALDYARYRVVSTNKSTGATGYYDIPGYPIGESSIIIQWDEQWSNFDVSGEDELNQPAWSGSLVKLPYNIDTSEDYNPSTNHVEYAGREHPVAYYSPQKGETATWNAEIPHTDKETLYTLRRLGKWSGDAYVREPSGVGYWASVKVNISRKHIELKIPVTLSITRVEGRSENAVYNNQSGI